MATIPAAIALGDRPERKFSGDKKFSRGAPRDRNGDPGDRGPRKDFGDRPGSRRFKTVAEARCSSPDHAGRNSRPPREGARNFDKPRFDKPRYDKPREGGGEERPRFSRPREDRPSGDRPFRERPKFDRPREVAGSSEIRPAPSAPEGRTDWQEHPRSETPSDRDSTGRAATTRTTARFLPSARPSAAAAPIASARPRSGARPRPPREKKSGERIAKVVSRAGLASRRDAEEWIVQGRVTVNGRVINSPALDVTAQRCHHRRRQAVAAARAHRGCFCSTSRAG